MSHPQVVPIQRATGRATSPVVALARQHGVLEGRDPEEWRRQVEAYGNALLEEAARQPDSAHIRGMKTHPPEEALHV